MKITNELKFIMQCNSFMGIVAGARLLTWGYHHPAVIAATVLNGLFLVLWVFIKAEDDNGPTNQK